MKRNILILSLLAICGSASAQSAPNHTPAPATQPAQQESHPLFRAQLYPSWSAITPKQAMVDTNAAILLAEEKIRALCSLRPEQMTFENTFVAYGSALSELEQTQQYLHHLISVKGDPELHRTQSFLMGALTQFDSKLIENGALWNTLKTAAAQPWVRDLDPEQMRLVHQTMMHFIHSGADLTPEQKKRKAAIHLALGRLAMQYGQNVQAASAEWSLLITDPAELRGVAPGCLAMAEREARMRGLSTPENPAWLITLTGGLAMDVVNTCNVAETRRKCWEGMQSPGSGTKYDNAPIIDAMMKLRQEYAQLIGYESYADLKAADRMMQTGQAALDFIDGMMRELKPAFDEETAQLLRYLSRIMNKEVTAIAPWDERKFTSMMAGEYFSFSTSAMRPYLEKERVINGLFSLCSQLFGVTYKELPTAYLQPGQTLPEGHVEVWHPEVKCYAVYDAASGAHLGSFFFDLHPRQGKRPGAWCMPLRMGHGTAEGKGVAEPHLAALVANFNASMPGQPVLFSHPELTIFFHEFGHMMHYMLGHTCYYRHSSPAVAWDFAEMPSQMLENWAWQPEVLATFAYHYQTGEPISQNYLQKLASSRYYMPATANMRSLCIAKLDLEVHMNYEEKFAGKNLDAVCAEMLAPYTAPFTVQAPSVLRNLMHCFQGGYAAGYYSYKWSETLSADAFLRFKHDGLFNAETGAAYRKSILETGDSKPATEIFRNFMGRDVDPDALLKAQGLK